MSDGGGDYVFHPFRLEVDARRLLRDGDELALTPKAFDTLVALVRRRSEVVRKQELMDEVWAGTFVEDAVLTQNIYTLRKTLDDRGPIHRLIATVPRIGYRFIAPVRHDAGDSGDSSPARPRSLAVLPFDTLGTDERGQAIGIGLADALTTRLSGLRRLTVRPTGAVLGGLERTRDPFELGHMLGVEAVLEGRLQLAGGRARLTAQLVSLARRGAIWGATFDEPADDLFALQDAIAERLAETLRLEVTSEERSLFDAGTRQGAAYDAYLVGRFLWNQRTGESLLRAVERFEEATRHDPKWALPHVGLADCHVLLPFYADTKPAEAFGAAREAAETALSIEPELPEALTVLAYTRLMYDRDREGAERDLQRALELRPEYATAHHWYGFLLASRSQFEDAVVHATRAVELDPLSLVNRADLGWVLYFARHDPEAIEVFRETLDLNAHFAYARLGLAQTLLEVGRPDEAVAEATRAAADSAGGSFARAVLANVLGRAGRRAEAERELEALRASPAPRSSRLALALAGLADRDAALDALEQAAAERSRVVVYLDVWPAYDGLRDTPRFRRLLKTVGRGAPGAAP